MKATLTSPLAEAHGQVLGRKAGVYARTNKKTGRVSVHPNPVRTKPPTDKQRAQTDRMRLATGRYREICADPALHAQLRATYEAQTRYRRFYDYVLAEILSGKLT